MNSDDSRRGNDTRYRPVGMGHGDTRKEWMCGHKSHKGQWIARTPYRCVACVKAKEQA